MKAGTKESTSGGEDAPGAYPIIGRRPVYFHGIGRGARQQQEIRRNNNDVSLQSRDTEQRQAPLNDNSHIPPELRAPGVDFPEPRRALPRQNSDGLLPCYVSQTLYTGEQNASAATPSTATPDVNSPQSAEGEHHHQRDKEFALIALSICFIVACTAIVVITLFLI